MCISLKQNLKTNNNNNNNKKHSIWLENDEI